MVLQDMATLVRLYKVVKCRMIACVVGAAHSVGGITMHVGGSNFTDQFILMGKDYQHVMPEWAAEQSGWL